MLLIANNKILFYIKTNSMLIIYKNFQDKQKSIQNNKIPRSDPNI